MRAAIVFLSFALAACGGGSPPTGDDSGGGDDDDGGGGGGGDVVDVFDPDTTDVRVEIDYETDEEPYTGNVVSFGDTFGLTVANIDRLFAGTKALEIPTTEAEMEEIGAVADEELTVGDLLDLAAMHRDLADQPGTKTYYVLFVSGLFTDGEGPREGVLGVSIGDTGVIAMFKDVIESTGLLAVPNLERYVEQSTLIHELGHAIGLVENGVPATSDHHDSEHGAHCSNDDCVMFWLNEGASDMADFARRSVLAGDSILFGDECLADVDALTGGP